MVKPVFFAFEDFFHDKVAGGGYVFFNISEGGNGLHQTDREHMILLTGFTGVIGKRLAYALAEKGRTILCPIRARDKEEARKRWEQAVTVLKEVTPDFDPKVVEHCIPVAGDLRKPDFGLNADEFKKHGFENVTEIWHLAAALDLTETNSAEVFETNVGGTRMLLELMARHGIKDMHYFSTFAVHGINQSERAPENLLAQEPVFRNSYEKSKWQTEHMVWQAHSDGRIRASIYRPSIVVGDSLHGRYEQFNAFNHAFDVASRLRKRLAEKEGVNLERDPLRYELRIPGVEDATLNIVPLDYVVEKVMRIYETGQWPGRVFHVTNPEPPRLSLMMEIFQRSEPWEGLRWSSRVGPEDFADGYEKFVYKQYGFLMPYLRGEAIFEQGNARSILNGHHPEVCNETFLSAIARRARQHGWQEM